MAFALVVKHASKTPNRMNTRNRLILFMLLVVVCQCKVTHVSSKKEEKTVTIAHHNMFI